MDAILLMMSLFLNPMQDCRALHATQQVISGEEFQILEYICGHKDFKIWQRKCADSDAWSLPFRIVDEEGRGFYINRFAEVQAAFVQVMPDDTYIPRCQS